MSAYRSPPSRLRFPTWSRCLPTSLNETVNALEAGTLHDPVICWRVLDEPDAGFPFQAIPAGHSIDAEALLHLLGQPRYRPESVGPRISVHGRGLRIVLQIVPVTGNTPRIAGGACFQCIAGCVGIDAYSSDELAPLSSELNCDLLILAGVPGRRIRCQVRAVESQGLLRIVQRSRPLSPSEPRIRYSGREAQRWMRQVRIAGSCWLSAACGCPPAWVISPRPQSTQPPKAHSRSFTRTKPRMMKPSPRRFSRAAPNQARAKRVPHTTKNMRWAPSSPVEPLRSVGDSPISRTNSAPRTHR